MTREKRSWAPTWRVDLLFSGFIHAIKRMRVEWTPPRRLG